ncbi:hypothetical protein DFQ01_13062 [Paenibacillus cellulosilyticus]|uniref:Zinc dependent phospholipase C n=1 Tax=Paenibacillus cellulosilyticus TaxID=375489 RepID=A0A2V2YP61_9BACL|nr:hypothetical protein [Paenibacillus cellulosilyticus]PWV94497.1 hypothetical protein DFQ01_13062 [Paenibacillus cellulosilyticus]QKS45007.1 hypothetical protein HUB94_11730 [Paenibacillus cellulosilyticus]
MPWPMVHFAISDCIYKGSPTRQLLIGSIAPDSIHARGSHVTREQKGFTHLVHQGIMPTKEMIWDKFLSYWPLYEEPEWKDFVLGYFSHIYTDLRWTETLYTDFEQAYTGGPSEMRGIYNEEVSQVEFDLIRSTRGMECWTELLRQTDGYTIDPFVTQQEVSQYRNEKVEWLRDTRNEPHITPIYFTTDRVERFIQQTAQEIQELLKEWLPVSDKR